MSFSTKLKKNQSCYTKVYNLVILLQFKDKFYINWESLIIKKRLSQFYLRQPSIFPQKRKIPLFLNHFNSTCTIFRSNFNNILSVYQIRYI